jgi:hypothetical protein
MITREQIEQSLKVLASRAGVAQSAPAGWLPVSEIARQWEVGDKQARKYMDDLIALDFVPPGKVYRQANGKQAMHYKII